MSENRKVKIIDTFYDEKRDLINLKVKDLETDKEVTWALSGADFDGFVSQMAGKSFSFSIEQRKELCKTIIDKEFDSIMESDLKKEIGKSKKDMEEFNKALDEYPYFEILDCLADKEEDD